MATLGMKIQFWVLQIFPRSCTIGLFLLIGEEPLCVSNPPLCPLRCLALDYLISAITLLSIH